MLNRLLVVLAVTLMLLLTACGGGAPSVGWSRPAQANSTLYVMSRGGRVYALDAGTGAKKWQYPADNSKVIAAPASSLYAAPVIAGDNLILAGSDRFVYVVNKDSGKEVCKFETGEAIIATPAAADGVVYVGSSDVVPALFSDLPRSLSSIPQHFSPASHKVYAIDVSQGACAKQWEFATADKVWAEPLVLGDRLYVASLDQHLYALERATGRKVWEFEAGGAIASSPKHADGVLYFGSFDTKVYAVDAATGRAKWSEPAPTGNWVWADPLLVGDKVIIGSLDGYVYALDARSGAQRWKLNTGPVRAAAAGREGIVFVGASSEDGSIGKLIALNADTGKEVWQKTVAVGARILSSPALIDGVVVVQNSNYQVLAYDAATGAEKWKYDTDK